MSKHLPLAPSSLALVAAAALSAVVTGTGCMPGSPSDSTPAPQVEPGSGGAGGRAGGPGASGGSGGPSTGGAGSGVIAGGAGGSAGSGAPALDAASGTDPGSDAATGTGGAGGTGATPAADGGPPATDPPGSTADGFAQVLQRSAIGVGYFTSCHVMPDLSLRCFGDRHPRTMPPAGLKTKMVSCAHDGCCALMPPESDVRVRCWSDKTTIIPPAALARSVNPIQIAIGYQQGCVLNADHSVACWGQPGTITTPPAGLKAKSLYSAAYWVCAISMEDDVVCWGINPPQPPAGLKAKLVSGIFHTGGHLDEARALTRHACAIKLDDTVTCWGDNVEGTTDVPPDLGPVKDIGTSTYSSCAVKPDGTTICWGNKILFPDPARWNPMPPNLKLKAIKGQFACYCGIQLDDTMVCWGDEKTSHLSVPPGMKVYVP